MKHLTLFLLPLLFCTPARALSRQDIQARERTLPLSPSLPEDASVHLYDVTDILDVLTPRTLELGEGLRGEYPTQLEEEFKTRRTETLRRLATGLERFVTPSWNKAWNRIEVLSRGVLAIVGDSEQHAWIGDCLEELRAGGTSSIIVQVKYLEIPRGGLSEVGIEESPLGSATQEQEASLREAIEDLSSHEGWNVLFAPEVLTRPFAPATLSVINQVAYVKEWQVHLVEPEKTLIADPVVDTVQEGYTLDLFCAALPEGNFGLKLDLVRADIERPIPTKKVRVATDPASDVSISTPVVTRVSLTSTFVVQPGRMVIFTTPTQDEERDLVVVIELNRLRAGGPRPDLSPVRHGSSRQHESHRGEG